MSDIFREVEEDVRRERLEKFWKQYGDYVIALIALILLAIAGYELWQRYEAGQRNKAAASYIADQRITNPAQAETAFAALSRTAPGGYGVLARLQQANALLEQGKTADAVTLYKQVAANDNGAIGAVARLRAGWATAASASRADLATLLAPLQDPASVWKEMAQEILAYADYRAGKKLVAQGEFARLAQDADAPDSLRSRARAFSAFLAEGGGVDFGTMPASQPAPAIKPGATTAAGAPGASAPATPAPAKPGRATP